MAARRKRTVAVLRRSTDKQDTAHQRQSIEKWAERTGTTIDEWKEGEPVSGAAARRPVLEKVMERVRKGSVGTLVFYELERMGRDMPRIVATISQIEAAGARVVTVRRGIDTGTPMGRAYAYIAGVFAEIELAAIRERVKSGMERARKAGKQIGRSRIEWKDEDYEKLVDLVDKQGHSFRKIVREALILVYDPGHGAKGPDGKRQGRYKTPSDFALRQAYKEAKKRLAAAS